MSSPMEDGNSVNNDVAQLSNYLSLDNIKQYLYDEDFSKQIIELLKEKGINRPEDLMGLPAQVEQEINNILKDLPKKSKSNSLIDTISDDDVKMFTSHW
jgi:DNA-binding transcriptional MerR regulator